MEVSFFSSFSFFCISLTSSPLSCCGPAFPWQGSGGMAEVLVPYGIPEPPRDVAWVIGKIGIFFLHPFSWLGIQAFLPNLAAQIPECCSLESGSVVPGGNSRRNLEYSLVKELIAADAAMAPGGLLPPQY